jgi:ribosomal protein L24E
MVVSAKAMGLIKLKTTKQCRYFSIKRQPSKIIWVEATTLLQ